MHKTHTHTHAHAQTYTYIHTYIHTHTHTHTYIHTHTHTHTHTYIHTYIHTDTHTHARTHIHIYVYCICTWDFVVQARKGERCNKSDRQTLHVYRNIEACYCNQCCSGEATSSACCECVFVALGIQHALRMRHIVVFELTHIYSIFPHYFTKATIL